MTKRIGGLRRKTRHSLAKLPKERGKLSLSRYFQEFNIGDRVAFSAEPSVKSGLFNRRFLGMSGIVKGKRGSCYEIKINDRGKEKIVITHPVHLKKIS